MMAIRHLAQRTVRRIRCRFGDHEMMTDMVPADKEAQTPAVRRLRCLHCLTVTPGWEQGPAAYRRTQEPDLKALTLPNPTLAEQAKPRAAAGGNVTKFRVAKRGRLR